jgi:hypothetical protein
MKIDARYVAVAVLLMFAWKGSSIDLSWPPATVVNIDTPVPEAPLKAWAEPLRKIVPRMTPKDRLYLASLYDAMAFVLLRDGQRDEPIIGTTGQFAAFHAGTLRLAIDRENVGKYPGLAEAIDEVFVAAAGPEDVRLAGDRRTRVTAACGVLSWAFGMNRDE